MTRVLAAMLVAWLSAGAAVAAEPHAWPIGPEPSVIQSDPWSDGAAATPHDDAYVFDDVAQAPGLMADAIAAATRADLERLRRAAIEPPPTGDRLSDVEDRVSWAFARFTAVGGGATAYASAEFARGRGGPTSLAEAEAPGPSIFAMVARR